MEKWRTIKAESDQSIIDLQWLDKGRHIYTFENICKEDNSIVMGDDAVKIILNAERTLDDVSQELKAFLDYAAGKKAESAFVERLDQAVAEAKRNRESLYKEYFIHNC